MIYLLRKPFKGSLAENALAHRCGGLNIDACRVPTDEYIYNHGRNVDSDIYSPLGVIKPQQSAGQKLGRWPANFILGCRRGPKPCPKASLDGQVEASRFFIQFTLEREGDECG
jgi:hypothetical protein